MEPDITISTIFNSALKKAKTQIWILTGLLVGFMIIDFTIGIFAMPMQESFISQTIVILIGIVINFIFILGYVKNLFQTIDGIEPQFSAYGQQSRKIVTAIVASLIFYLIVISGSFLFIIPGIYLSLRLEFFIFFIVEEDAGIIESLRRSWKITKGHILQLFFLRLIMIAIATIGLMIFIVGIFFAMPIIFIMYCEVFRKLNTPLQILEEDRITHE